MYPTAQSTSSSNHWIYFHLTPVILKQLSAVSLSPDRTENVTLTYTFLGIPKVPI